MESRLICMALGYLFGCFLTAEFVSKHMFDVSIFTLGSKNPGLANVAIELGAKPALLVFFGDAFKVLIPLLIALYLPLHLDYTLTVFYVGLGTTLGHNYPFWHKFVGGEGVMTTCTTLVLATPLQAIASLFIGAVCVCVTQFLNISAVLICTVYTLWAWFFTTAEIAYLSAIFTILSAVANRGAIAKMFGPDAQSEKVDVLGALKKKLRK